jgi:hypothetical protein
MRPRHPPQTNAQTLSAILLIAAVAVMAAFARDALESSGA